MTDTDSQAQARIAEGRRVYDNRLRHGMNLSAALMIGIDMQTLHAFETGQPVEEATAEKIRTAWWAQPKH